MKYSKCFLCGKDVNLNYYGECFKHNDKSECGAENSECVACYKGAHEKSCENCGKAIITYCCYSSDDYNINKEIINKNIKKYLQDNKNSELCITTNNLSNFIKVKEINL